MSIRKICTIIFGVLSLTSFAKGFDGHKEDMYAILPFENSPAVTNWLHQIHQTIDIADKDKNGISSFPELYQEPHKNFTMGIYGHRILFHWGFNSEPWSNALDAQMQKTEWTAAQIDAFKLKLKLEQKKRNKKVIESTCKTFGFVDAGRQGLYANSLASLVYDIHLLGDYTTTRVEPLQDISVIIKDIKAAVEKLSGIESREFLKKLDFNINKYTNATDQASSALLFLKLNFGHFILKAQNGFFKQWFTARNITLK